MTQIITNFHVQGNTQNKATQHSILHYFSRAPITNYHKLVKPAEIYSPRVLEARSVKSRWLWWGHVLSKGSGKNPSLPLPCFWQLWAILDIHWLVDASLQSLPPQSHCLLPCVAVSLNLSPLKKSKEKENNPITGFRAHPPSMTSS